MKSASSFFFFFFFFSPFPLSAGQAEGSGERAAARSVLAGQNRLTALPGSRRKPPSLRLHPPNRAQPKLGRARKRLLEDGQPAQSNFSSFPRTSGWAEDQPSPVASAPHGFSCLLPAGKELQAPLCRVSYAWPSLATAGGKPPAILRGPLTQPTRSPAPPDLINLLICP